MVALPKKPTTDCGVGEHHGQRHVRAAEGSACRRRCRARLGLDMVSRSAVFAVDQRRGARVIQVKRFTPSETYESAA